MEERGMGLLRNKRDRDGFYFEKENIKTQIQTSDSKLAQEAKFMNVQSR
jgi:hypothetical protein